MVDEALLSQIYDAIIDNDPWSSFLHNFRMRLHSNSAMLMFSLPSTSTVNHDIDDSDWQVSVLKRLYYTKYRNLNPIRYQDMEYGKVYSMYDFISQEDYEAAPYYQEFCRHQGINHALIAYLGEAEGVKAWLNVARGNDMGPYSAEDAKLISDIVPHLHRALRIYGVIKKTRIEKSIYMDALDSIKLCTVLLDQAGRVVDMNDLAEQLLQRSSVISIIDRRIMISNSADKASFAKLFNDVVSDVSETDYGVQTIGVTSDTPINLLLRRFEQTQSDTKGGGALAAILYLKDPREQFHARTEAVAILYGLKPTEARLAVEISAGASIKDAALKLGMTEQTARTYVKRILQKTNTRRQADLVQLIGSGLAVMV